MKMVILKRLIIIFNALTVILCLCSCSLSDFCESTCIDVNKYTRYYGENGKNKKLYIGYNDIFPNSINTNAVVKQCIIKKFSLLDDSYVSYLVINYSMDDYINEKTRLKELNSSNNYNVYGISGFSKELCAIYASDSFGIIYALSDDISQEIAYVDIQFCNYFVDIDYTKVIDSIDLPIGFNALKNNPVHQRFQNEGFK